MEEELTNALDATYDALLKPKLDKPESEQEALEDDLPWNGIKTISRGSGVIRYGE